MLCTLKYLIWIVLFIPFIENQYHPSVPSLSIYRLEEVSVSKC